VEVTIKILQKASNKLAKKIDAMQEVYDGKSLRWRDSVAGDKNYFRRERLGKAQEKINRAIQIMEE